MKKPNDRQLTAINALTGNHEFEVYQEWLRSCNEEVSNTLLIATDPVQIWRAQGACQVLTELLAYAENAEKILRRR